MSLLNLYVHEHLVATHCQDMQREAEQYRLIARLPRKQRSVVRYAVGMLGRGLVTVGTRMRQVEPRTEPVKA
jgi:hypothetical protein